MKFFLILLILLLTFGLGYYVGQRPEAVKQKLRELSGDVLENTIGLDKSLKLRREFLEAKDRLIQSKAYLLDHEYEKAGQELEDMLRHLTSSEAVDPDGRLDARVEELRTEVQEARQQLAAGQGVSRQTLDELQAKLDDLLP